MPGDTQKQRRATGVHHARQQQRAAMDARQAFVFTPATVANNPFLYALSMSVLLTYGASMAEAAANRRASHLAARDTTASLQQALANHPDWHTTAPGLSAKDQALCSQQQSALEQVFQDSKLQLDGDTARMAQLFNAGVGLFCTTPGDESTERKKEVLIESETETTSMIQATSMAHFSAHTKQIVIPNTINDAEILAILMRHESRHAANSIRTGNTSPFHEYNIQKIIQLDQALNHGLQEIQQYLEKSSKTGRHHKKRGMDRQTQRINELLNNDGLGPILETFAHPSGIDINKFKSELRKKIGGKITIDEITYILVDIQDDYSQLKTSSPLDTLRALKPYVDRQIKRYTSTHSLSNTLALKTIEKEAYIRQVLGEQAWKHFFHQAQQLIDSDEQKHQESLSPRNRLS